MLVITLAACTPSVLDLSLILNNLIVHRGHSDHNYMRRKPSRLLAHQLCKKCYCSIRSGCRLACVYVSSINRLARSLLICPPVPCEGCLLKGVTIIICYIHAFHSYNLGTFLHTSYPTQGHNREVYSVAVSPDGRTVVSGSDDTTVK